MGSYSCDDCGGKMEYSHSDKRGSKYKCVSCGNTGYIDGMSEEQTGGIDPSAFGF